MREQYERAVPTLENDELRKLYKRFSWHGESKAFFEFLAARFKDFGSSRDGTNCEPMINGFFRAYLLGRKDYMAMPELELNGRYCDYALFPSQLLPEAERPLHSYVIELKHAPESASASKIDAKHREVLKQLAGYAKSPNLARLAAGTPVHFLDIEFKGRKMIVCEEV